MRLINLPVGISSFEQLRESRCYYVDKTGLIRAVLKMPGIQGSISAVFGCPIFGKQSVQSVPSKSTAII